MLVAVILNVPAGKAVFVPLNLQPGGPLRTGVPYVFRVADAGNGTAVMLQAVVRNRLELEETWTVPAGSSVDLGFTIPSRASRVILVLDLVEEHGEVTVTVLDQFGNTVIPPRTFSFSASMDPDPSRRGGVRGRTLSEALYESSELQNRFVNEKQSSERERKKGKLVYEKSKHRIHSESAGGRLPYVFASRPGQATLRRPRQRQQCRRERPGA